MDMKKIAILGSTGSIGTQTLEVVRENQDIQVMALAAGSNIELLEAQIREFRPVLAAVWEEEKAKELRENIKDLNVKVVSGMDGLKDVAVQKDTEILVTAIVGMIGILPTIEGIRAGKNIHIYEEFQLYNLTHGKEDTAELTVERDGKEQTIQMEKRLFQDETTKRMGFTYSADVEKPGFFKSIQYGAYTAKYWVEYTLECLKMLLTGEVGVNQLSGPVGIVDVVNDTYDAAAPSGWSAVILSMMNLGILISANLGVMNLLPIPALDGGRLVFLLIEAVRKKRISPEKEGMVHFIGFAALMALMVFVMYNDIMRLF